MENSSTNNLAIIGAGPTSLFLLQHITENSKALLNHFNEITIFEKSSEFGFGMPYNLKTTDTYNIANICCEEIPKLPQSLNEWILSQDEHFFKKWNIDTENFEEHDLYSRILLGNYFQEQFNSLILDLKTKYFKIVKRTNSEIKDISQDKIKDVFLVIEKSGKSTEFNKIVIATGHQFTQKDTLENNYFATPWPIQKLFPKKNEVYDFPVGILGASLSAFDVASSLAHRHGIFVEKNGDLVFKLDENAANFKIVFHSVQGWLPHLQYEQLEPFREIYRHTSRKQLLQLVAKNGLISLEDFFNKIARKVLITALEKDKKTEIATLLSNPKTSWSDLISVLSAEHDYVDSFAGMEKELQESLAKTRSKKPTFWMETLDDLMYCLNFHSELISAEDHIFLRTEIMPFLMNVIAALPLKSAKILIALRNANCIDLVQGEVEILEVQKQKGKTEIKVTSEKGKAKSSIFELFVNCAGQEIVSVESYPFPSLEKLEIISAAKAKFSDEKLVSTFKDSKWQEKITKPKNQTLLDLGGIAVDYDFKVINKDGEVQENLYDLSCSHISGIRPYSYGLQASDANAAVLVASWLHLEDEKISIEEITDIYDGNI